MLNQDLLFKIKQLEDFIVSHTVNGEKTLMKLNKMHQQQLSKVKAEIYNQYIQNNQNANKSFISIHEHKSENSNSTVNI